VEDLVTTPAAAGVVTSNSSEDVIPTGFELKLFEP